MKNILLLGTFFSFFSVYGQTTISAKVGSNPVFIDAGQNYVSQGWTLDGGWGYRAGLDMSHNLSGKWSLFHGAAISVNKLKYSHRGYAAISGNYNLYVEGYQAWTFSVPVGVAYHFKVGGIKSQIRGVAEWNTGIGGNVKGYQTNFNAIGLFDRKIDFLSRETTNTGVLHNNRFSIGFESVTKIWNRLNVDAGYMYSMTDVMFDFQLPGKRSRLHSIFAGVNYELFHLGKKSEAWKNSR